MQGQVWNQEDHTVTYFNSWGGDEPSLNWHKDTADDTEKTALRSNMSDPLGTNCESTEAAPGPSEFSGPGRVVVA